MASRRLLAALASLVLASGLHAQAAAPWAPLTAGWRPEKVEYKVHWPYDVPQASRFALQDGVFHLWVFSKDKPLRPGNTTKPRSELRFPEYLSGAQQYAADLMVPSGTFGTCVMQIHTGDAQSPKFGATTFMLFFEPTDGGSLHFYSRPQVLAKGLYDHWFHLNVIHDVTAGTVTAYLDGHLISQTRDQHAGDYYMKTGVYGQHGMSPKMEVYIRNLQLWSR